MTRTKQQLGFTLIEMMVVIGIIALLAALTLGISNSVIRNSEIRQTKDALKLFEMAMQEWELERGREVTYEGHVPLWNGNYDISGNAQIEEPGTGNQGVSNVNMEAAMERRCKDLITLLLQSENAKTILSKISPDLFVKDINEYILIDAWGTAVGVVFPGRRYLEVYPDDDAPASKDESGDLSLRDEAEDGLGSCKNLKPYFVSSGPDGEFGYRFQYIQSNGQEPNEPLFKSSLDNVYSYDPFLVEEAR